VLNGVSTRAMELLSHAEHMSHFWVTHDMVCKSWTATCTPKPYLAMALFKGSRSRSRSHVLHGPPDSPEVQDLVSILLTASFEPLRLI